MSIRARILIALVLVVAGGFWLLIDWVVDDLRPRYLEATEESLVDTANLLAAVLATGRDGDGFDLAVFGRAVEEAQARTFRARIYELEKARVDLEVYVTDDRGIVVYDSDGGRAVGEDFGRWNDVHRTLRGGYGARSTRLDPEDPRTSVQHVAAPVLVDGELKGCLTVRKPIVSANLFIDRARRQILIAGGGAAGVVLLLGVLTSAWVTRPLRALTRYAAAVRDGRRAALPDLGKTEIGAMAQSLEEMREALEGKAYVERYVQTLTHEVKGPLSAIRGAVELLKEPMPANRRERFLSNVLAETGRIGDIVDRLLLLSSLEGRSALRDVEDMDLAALAAEAAEGLAAAAEARQVTITTAVGAGVRLRGERFLLRHALVNLLQNALAFSPAGGEVVLAGGIRDGAVEVAVTDQGPGIPDYALPRVFDRFYSLPRPDTGAKSSGLGLAFVREVAHLHGGEADIQNRPGGGAIATLRLAAQGGEEG